MTGKSSETQCKQNYVIRDPIKKTPAIIVTDPKMLDFEVLKVLLKFSK